MIVCPKCGHQNLPSYPTCSRCATALPAGMHQSAADEARQMLNDRARITRRNRTVSIGVAIAALGFFAFRYVKDRKEKGNVQEKLDYVTRWIDLEKRETGSFWTCALGSDVDIGQFNSAGQIQQKIESVYVTQMQTFSEHLLTECVPKLEAASQAFASLDPAPAELRAPMEEHKAALPELKKGITLYAERLRDRGSLKDIDQLIQQTGDAWHTDQRPTPEAVAFDRFMHCAVPGLEKMKDAQAMLEFLADACYKKDPVSFMDRVRKDCGPLLANPDPKAAPSKTFKATQKRFYEDERRQLQAWDSCGRRSRKGKKVDDLGDFLVAVGDYMAARGKVAEAARALAKN
jgi:hypothetical protein